MPSPAGEYTALRVVIGEGAGQNWWCVAFPPLCLGAASETVEEAAQAGRFTDDQAALMTGEDPGICAEVQGHRALGGAEKTDRGLKGNGRGRPEGLPRLSFAKDSMNLLHGTIYNLTLEKMY